MKPGCMASRRSFGPRRLRQLPMFVAMACAAVSATHAATTSYGVSVGIGQSDNIARTAANEQSETLASAGLNFSIAKNTTAKLRATAAADLAYVDYLDGFYDNEVVGNLNASAVIGLIPERIEWFFQDSFGQVRSNPFQPVTPANRENINYFTTGPDLTLRLGSMARARLSGRYSKVSYEDSPFDNDRFGGGLSFLRDLSAATVLSANLQTEKIEYDSNLAGSDYDRQDAFLGYTATGSRTRANLELGYSKLNRSGVQDSKGLLARFDVHRQLSQFSALSLRVGREFSDSSSAFRLQQGFSGVSLETQPVLQTSSPFISKYASLGWDFNGHRTGLGVAVTRFDEAYEQQTAFDRTRTVATAQAYRDLQPNLRFLLEASVAKENFSNTPGDFRETTGAAQLSWQAGRQLTVSLRYDHARRNADVGGLGYRENRGWLQLMYGRRNEGPRSRAPRESNF